MYGLPDSAILGTAKRLKSASSRGRRGTEVGWEDFFAIVGALKRVGARRRLKKQRADFYKKHGYYRQ
jgi:hypothetical protein